MTRTERIDGTDIRFRRQGSGDRALVFVHGFLDDQYVWDGVIAELTTQGFETLQLDLAGSGDRTGAEGPFTLERFAADVGAVVDAVDKPFVLVGQSMGAPVAELVAARRASRAMGLVLLTPAPLAGTGLPDEAIEQFRSLGGKPEAQRATRQQLSVALPEAELDRLVVTGSRVPKQVVRDVADCWNNGHPDGSRSSDYQGPVLIVRGAGDGFVTEELVADAVAPRFLSVETMVVEGAGHWAHIESPKAVAAAIDTLLTALLAVRADNASQGWRGAFTNKSTDDFGKTFATDVVLEASVITRPIEGREKVKVAMGTASGIYESLDFTHEASNGSSTYLEWEATAFGGVAISGVTVLTRNDRGQILRAAIHHRPLGAALAFSAEMRKRLDGAIDPSHFYDHG
jgi:pimeloyl-ACP methyl ester carboxylesterase